MQRSTKGDFVKIDPIKQQEEILTDIKRLTAAFEDETNRILVISINSTTDYILAKEVIIKEFSKL